MEEHIALAKALFDNFADDDLRETGWDGLTHFEQDKWRLLAELVLSGVAKHLRASESA